MKNFAIFSLLVVVASGAVLKSARTAKKQCRLEAATFDWRIIFPGTKWCGDGNVAEDYDDLGVFVETDKCCRTHDHCDDFIAAGGSNHGLNNTGKYTKLHCNCDTMFFDCLDETSCAVSNIIGTTYFNILGGQCYDLKPPATCVEYDDILGLRPRCVTYEYDDTKPKEWQWFDVPRWIFGPECDDLADAN